MILGVDRGSFSEHHASVALALQNIAERRSDIGWRKRARGHLVEKRLEEVIVAAIDERGAHAPSLHSYRRAEAAKAPANDHHMMCIRHVSLNPVEIFWDAPAIG